MGLLDALFPASDGGGLLDFLKRNSAAAIANNPGGLPSDTAQYGAPIYAPSPPIASAPLPSISPAAPSPLDNAQWPAGPIGAPSNAQAQMPTQANAPAPATPLPVPQVGNTPATSPLASATSPGFMTGYENFRNGGGLIGSIMAGITGQRNDPQGIALAQQAQTANVTARALIAKGVDPQTAIAAVQPGNGEMLKQLLSTSFGAPKAPTTLGNGYIWNPQTQKVERAYTPDDKIPVGFQQTDKGLEPIPGGPADPAYIRMKATQGTDPNATHVLGKGGELYKTNADGSVTIIHKNDDNTDATLSDDATKAMAAQYLAGDRTVLTNLGRGAQGAANIVKLREEITKQAAAAGMNAQDIVTTFNEQAGNLAGQRTVGTRAANISLAANEANNMIPIALAASAKVPRGQWVPWNQMVQAYQKGTSSPELASFVAATNSLVNAYVRAVSPNGVPTDSMREHAYSMLNSAQSPEAYAAVINTMKQEMQSALNAPAQVRKELRAQSGTSGSVPAQSAPASGALPQGWSVQVH